MKGYVLLLSGGMDSAVLLASIVAAGRRVVALSVDYGQRHRRELDAASDLAAYYKVPHEVVTIPPAIVSGSALTGGGPVPHGHYADPSMRVTVVPNRNMILIAYAAAVAARDGLDRVAYAAHGGDHAIYPDCRPEFVKAMSLALGVCHYDPIELHCPFLNKSKADIALIGDILSVPFRLTWSCYEGGEKPCGQCGTCVERAEAFRDVSLTDPLVSEIGDF